MRDVRIRKFWQARNGDASIRDASPTCSVVGQSAAAEIALVVDSRQVRNPFRFFGDRSQRYEFRIRIQVFAFHNDLLLDMPHDRSSHMVNQVAHDQRSYKVVNARLTGTAF